MSKGTTIIQTANITVNFNGIALDDYAVRQLTSDRMCLLSSEPSLRVKNYFNASYVGLDDVCYSGDSGFKSNVSLEHCEDSSILVDKNKEIPHVCSAFLRLNQLDGRCDGGEKKDWGEEDFM